MRRKDFKSGSLESEADDIVSYTLGIPEGTEFYYYVRDVVLLRTRLEGLKRYYDVPKEEIKLPVKRTKSEILAEKLYHWLGLDKEYEKNRLARKEKNGLTVGENETIRELIKRLNEIISDRRCYYLTCKGKMESKGLQAKKLVPDEYREKLKTNNYMEESLRICTDLNYWIDSLVDDVKRVDKLYFKPDWKINEKGNAMKTLLTLLEELDNKNMLQMRKALTNWEKEVKHQQKNAPKKVQREIRNEEQPGQSRGKYSSAPLYREMRSKKTGKKVTLKILKQLAKVTRKIYSKNKRRIKAFILAAAIAKFGTYAIKHIPEIIPNNPTESVVEVEPKLSDWINEVYDVRPAAITYLSRALKNQNVNKDLEDKDALIMFFDGLEDAYENGNGKEFYATVFNNVVENYIKTTIANGWNEVQYYKTKSKDVKWEYYLSDFEKALPSYEISVITSLGKEESIAINNVGSIKWEKNNPVPKEFENLLKDFTEFKKNSDKDSMQNVVRDMTEVCKKRYIAAGTSMSYSLVEWEKAINFSSVRRQFGYNKELHRKFLAEQGLLGTSFTRIPNEEIVPEEPEEEFEME